MSNLSTYVQEALYNWMLNNTAMPATVATVYIGLSTADPLDDASGLAEPADVAYARQPVTFGALASVNGVGTSGSNSAGLIFPTALAPWGSITHGVLYDALVAGNMLEHWAWAVPKGIGIGDTYVVAISDLAVLFR